MTTHRELVESLYAERDALQAEVDELKRVNARLALTPSPDEEALRAERELLARWIVDYARYLRGAADHACARCVPGGPLVSKTFTCARHLAEDIQRAALAGEGG